MKKLTLLFLLILYNTNAKADNVILMIGDGMGSNHIKCAAMTNSIYLSYLPVKGFVTTHSANSKITDSAAAATAYSCGIKTNNNMLAKFPDGGDCLTIAEEAQQQGISVSINSTDYSTGATPSAFYAHVSDKNNKKEIETYKQIASQKMDINVPVRKISDSVSLSLKQIEQNQNGFFAMFEGAKIDVHSHANDLEKMKEELYDFDLAVMKASDFVYDHPETTLIVLADHETGGLTEDCTYTTQGHTGINIPLYSYGKHAELFEELQDNTDIYRKIHKILFNE